MQIGTNLFILAMTYVNRVSRTFGDTDPATLAKSRVDFRNVLFINPGNPVRAAHDTDQTGSTALWIYYGNRTAHPQFLAGQK